MLPPGGKCPPHQLHAGSRCNVWRSWVDLVAPSTTVSPGPSLCGWDSLQGRPGWGLKTSVKQEKNINEGAIRLFGAFKSTNLQFVILMLKRWGSDRSLASGEAISCGWQSRTCGKCPRCRGRASLHAPTSFPAPWGPGSYHWPGGTLALRSADRQTPRHTVDSERRQRWVTGLCSPLNTANWLHQRESHILHCNTRQHLQWSITP